MSSSVSTFTLIASGTTAVGLIAALFLVPDFAHAADSSRSAGSAACECPRAGSSKPKLAAIPSPLGPEDEVAALESLQIALSKVADGSSYVWHRSHGRLSGIVRPTSSFKDAKGQVCRHITVVLSSDDTTKRTEAIACRLGNGVWQVDG